MLPLLVGGFASALQRYGSGARAREFCRWAATAWRNAMQNAEADLTAALGEYLELACQAQNTANIERGRRGILSLPRAWTVAHIEAAAEPLLQTNDEWEWRRLLEVYERLDEALLRKLAVRATSHQDPDIREAGQDILDWLAGGGL